MDMRRSSISLVASELVQVFPYRAKWDWYHVVQEFGDFSVGHSEDLKLGISWLLKVDSRDACSVHGAAWVSDNGVQHWQEKKP